MAEIVEMIALSPTMEEGTLAEWRVSEGDTVSEGDIIADVETDKATMEMESWYDGTLLEFVVGEHEAVAVGDPIAIIGEEGEDISELLDRIQAGQTGSAEPAEASGAGAEEAEQTGDETVSPPEDQPSGPDDAAPPASGAAEPGAPTEDRLRASPLARRIAAEHGADLTAIEGSGPSGRIIERDVEDYLERGEPRPAQRSTPEVSDSVLQPPDLPGEQKPLSQMRKTISERLTASWKTTPHFALTVDIDMAAAMDFRAEVNEQLEAADREQKISVNDLIVKASADALRAHPTVNVSFQGDHVVQFDDVHVGFAVAVEEGLVTPTIRNADEKSLGAIAEASRRLAQKARDKDLEPQDYADGTFTVSNLGMYGIDHFMAVINPPQAAILACGGVREVPVAEDGEIEVGTRMKVTLSCDHRAVDGAMGAEFLDEITTRLENPVLLSV